ncbi:MAG: MBOAT family protein [Muribaculaceae bacterium]|nr:MBOAT family protein [Muribaculaceae bacterium]
MILNSFDFIIALPLVLFLYVIILRLCRNSKYLNIISAALLTALSYAFFIFYQPVGALLLFAITVLTYTFAIIADKNRENSRQRFIMIVVGVLIVLTPLILFKYSAFINQLLASLLDRLDIRQQTDSTDTQTKVFIPLGISFFTFQSLGYLWDVHRNKISVEKNFLYYMLFVGFFPQITSGPISKADELLPQIRGKRSITREDITEGVRLMLWGYFMKAVVADRVAMFVTPVYADYENFSGVTCIIATLFYSIQIYGDFAGYSLLAIGVGRLFGFKLINNFKRPYFSYSITEFWRRWHISLSRWLRDYVYIPLGGSRKGKGRTHLNILTTFLVSGIWHGANLTFIFWGFIHGIIQVVEKFFGFNAKPKSRVVIFFRIVLTFLLTSFAWIFFRMPTLSDSFGMIRRIFTLAPGASLSLTGSNTVLISFAVVSFILTEVIQEYMPKVRLLHNPNSFVRCVAIVAITLIIMTVGVLDAGQFIYVNF